MPSAAAADETPLSLRNNDGALRGRTARTRVLRRACNPNTYYNSNAFTGERAAFASVDIEEEVDSTVLVDGVETVQTFYKLEPDRDGKSLVCATKSGHPRRGGLQLRD